MTNTAELRERARVADETLSLITTNLNDALEDVTLLERLKSAEDRAKRLTAEQDRATKERTKAHAAEAKAVEEGRFTGISDVQVKESPNTVHENVVRSGFTVSYASPTWDGYESRPTRHSRDGFGLLPSIVLDYIIEKRPELIPAKIMALAPDSPSEAFRRYFLSIRRGYVAA